MSSVKCPLCNESISGEGPGVLSQTLKEHLYSLHELKVVDAVTRFNAEPPGGGSEKAMKEIDAVKRFNAEPPGGGSEKAMKEIDAVKRFSGTPPEGSPGSQKGVDAVTRFNAEPSSGSTPQAGKMIEVVTRFKGDYPNGCAPECQQLLEEVTKFQNPTGPDKARGKGAGKGKAMISCPFCDTIVHGKDDNDLSVQLREHIVASHRA